MDTIPKIDFSGVDPGAGPGDQASWNAVRAEVVAALTSWGCFEAACGSNLCSDLREDLFGKRMDELFSLPDDALQRNVRDWAFGGYDGRVHGRPYDTLAISDVQSSDAVAEFTRLMWPDVDNPGFREALECVLKNMLDLEAIVWKMVLEIFGVWDAHRATAQRGRFHARLWKYPPSVRGADAAVKTALSCHRDESMITILCQNGVDGLSVCSPTDSDAWTLVAPSATSFIVQAGELLRAWSNGRVHAPLHRVQSDDARVRYSMGIISVPGEERTIRAPRELFDDDHPPLFPPFNYDGLVAFAASPAGLRSPNPLDEYLALNGAADASNTATA